MSYNCGCGGDLQCDNCGFIYCSANLIKKYWVEIIDDAANIRSILTFCTGNCATSYLWRTFGDLWFEKPNISFYYDYVNSACNVVKDSK